jgi:hypothetical protein
MDREKEFVFSKLEKKNEIVIAMQKQSLMKAN